MWDVPINGIDRSFSAIVLFPVDGFAFHDEIDCMSPISPTYEALHAWMAQICRDLSPGGDSMQDAASNSSLALFGFPTICNRIQQKQSPNDPVIPARTRAPNHSHPPPPPPLRPPAFVVPALPHPYSRPDPAHSGSFPPPSPDPRIYSRRVVDLPPGRRVSRRRRGKEEEDSRKSVAYASAVLRSSFFMRLSMSLRRSQFARFGAIFNRSYDQQGDQQAVEEKEGAGGEHTSSSIRLTASSAMIRSARPSTRRSTVSTSAMTAGRDWSARTGWRVPGLKFRWRNVNEWLHRVCKGV